MTETDDQEVPANEGMYFAKTKKVKIRDWCEAMAHAIFIILLPILDVYSATLVSLIVPPGLGVSTLEYEKNIFPHSKYDQSFTVCTIHLI